MRIINFAQFKSPTNPIYFEHEILKLCDMVRLNNLLLVHDFLTNVLPVCFEAYFVKLKLKYISFKTRNSVLTGLYVPSVNKTSTGIHSITFRSIQVWNNTCKTLAKMLSKKLSKDKYLELDLSKLPRFDFKKIITGMFLSELTF